MIYHKPALLDECINGLNIKPEGIYVDVTYGGAGHTIEILNRLTTGSLIAFDQDEDAINNNKIVDKKFKLINQNFKYLKNNLKVFGIDKVDGILADLGISSHQIDVPERGFSTRYDAELDLRMDRKNGNVAKDIVNNYSVDDLKQIFLKYGELKNAYKIAVSIDVYRKNNPINTIFNLKEALQHIAPKGKENKFYAQVFQALRIEVNDELNVLKDMLIQSVDVLKSSARLVVISYHSLEDRLVKNFMKSGNFEGKIEKDFYGNLVTPFNVITKKPITPLEAELNNNSRSRSAKLRIAQKI